MPDEKSRIAKFLRTIDADDLIALAPSSGRFDQEEGHDEARQVAAARGIDNPSWVFWHRQSAWVFDANGDLVSGLLMHWGGDHDRVLTALTALPAPFRVIDHGPGGAFEIVSDSTDARRNANFPDVADTKAVKARIKAITGPVERRKPETWTPAELGWFESVLLQGDLAAQGAVVGWITKSPKVSVAALDHLVENWTSIYSKAPKWVLVSDLLCELDRRSDPRLDTLLDGMEKRKAWVYRAGASDFLAERLLANPRGDTAEADLERLARFAHDPGRYPHLPGNIIALDGLVEALVLREGKSEAEVAAALLEDATFDEAARNALAESID